LTRDARAWYQRFKPYLYELLSSVHFRFNLRHHMQAMEDLSQIQVVPLMQEFLFKGAPSAIDSGAAA
jgi:hypothetical protein